MFIKTKSFFKLIKLDNPKKQTIQNKHTNNNIKILIRDRKSIKKLKYSSTRSSKKKFNVFVEVFSKLKFLKKFQRVGKKYKNAIILTNNIKKKS